ncbi:hypothetical protein V8E55_006741, partial [Tylopilus felleus]
PVVFGARRLQDLYNELMARQFANDARKEFHVYLAVDKIAKEVVRGEDRIRLSYAQANESKEALGCLPLIPGMPVMVTENLSMQNKIVNSSQGVLSKVIYRTVPEGREAVCAYVKIANSLIAIEGLPRFIVPIFLKNVQFSHRIAHGKTIRITRSQLPLVPAWAFTDYKVQGASMDSVIVDLASARGIQNAYVMLS